MNEHKALLILNAIKRISPLKVHRLLKFFKSARTILSLPKSVLRNDAGLSEAAADELTAFDQDGFLKKELKLIQDRGISVVMYSDTVYPEILKEIPDAPVVLYVKGDPAVLSGYGVSLVGSRLASLYGMQTAEKLSMALTEYGITVISGLARGIDTAAHRGAVRAHGKTVAVLGSGLADIYPRENRKLADQIAQSGAVASEFPMTTPPISFNFPRRNRIISGLSRGVVVVEAARRSGALITARCALDYGREVFAVPGNINTPSAAGPNALIKDGAKLVLNVEDIIEELKFDIVNAVQSVLKPKTVQSQKVDKDLSKLEQKIISVLSGGLMHVDDLSLACGVSVVSIMPALLSLEIENLIHQKPGKLFELSSALDLNTVQQ